MGIKFLILQRIPWCFPMTGSTNACHHPDQPTDPSNQTLTTDAGDDAAAMSGKASVKLIRADGRVEVYHGPVSAAELMTDHPMHLVCRSDALTIGERIPSLPPGEQLQPGHAYFLLPLHFFQSVLSFVTFARAAAAAAPFDVQRTPAGALQIRVSDDFVERVSEKQEGGGGGGGRLCTTAALEKDYRQLVVGCRARQWKPRLETITESERGKGSGGTVGAAAAALGGVGRRRQKSHHGSLRNSHRIRQQQQQQERHELQQEEQQQQQQEREKEEEEEEEEQQQQQKQKQHQKREEPKVSTMSLLLNPTLPHKSKGKKVVACDV